ncbi:MULTISPECIES: DUF2304 domain-containing protein [unclassified Leifsonia]|uniref:DUF2304 domain-containing protein n=1 Tax=unclassified Leifsonia TaxID=2663824 RepID=UPI00035D15B6|nr:MULTISPECIES: DUF2304 domain-containing protein [unclassified Leifsonia]TDQ02873.1 hypothetical protein AXZ95_1153 [Leifsonia sp. 115AMFTsu3.1]
MSVTLYVLGILAALLTLGVVIEMMRRKRLRERHAIWWLLAGTLALIVGIFPSILDWAAGVIGVGVPVNLVFFVTIAVLFLVCIQASSELTTLEDKTRSLGEQTVLLQLRLQELERRLAATEGAAASPEGVQERRDDALEQDHQGIVTHRPDAKRPPAA